MNTEEVIKELQQKYPGKNIIKNTEVNPTEIICELDPASEHSEYSVAIAVVDEIKPHYHKVSTETYKVIKGQLNLSVDDGEFYLSQGDEKVINPNQIHSATGNETWIKVYSEPGWTPGDHLLSN